jgi:hypothetical protein
MKTLDELFAVRDFAKKQKVPLVLECPQCHNMRQFERETVGHPRWCRCKNCGMYVNMSTIENYVEYHLEITPEMIVYDND